MNKLFDEEKITTTQQLNKIINEFSTSFNKTKDEIENIYNQYKAEMQSLCEKYQQVDLPEIDALEFHETYSEEYKNSRKQEYLELSKIDRELYKSFVLASYHEYYILEIISKLSGEDVNEVGKGLIENIKKVFEELDKTE
jgi:hypothetical protein